MEIAVIIIAVTFIAWVLGFVRSARVIADIANTAVISAADKHTRTMIRDRVNAQPLTAEEVAAATEDIKKMEEIRSLFR